MAAPAADLNGSGLEGTDVAIEQVEEFMLKSKCRHSFPFKAGRASAQYQY